MNWQQLISLTIVAVTAALFVGARWRQRRGGFKNSNPCGCSTPRRDNPPPRITFHARKGQRPEVKVQL